MTPGAAFIKLSGGPGIRKPRVVLIGDAHGRIVMANCHTRQIDAHMEIYPSPDCMHLSVFLPWKLENIHRLLREDERRNDRLFDDAMTALEQINTGQEYVLQRYHGGRA